MRAHPPIAVAFLLLSACASPGPSERIKRKEALFDTFPPPVQEKIRSGKVEPGFTREMVRMALGEPDRTYTHKTEMESLDVWAYLESKGGMPGVGLSLGMGSVFGGSGAYSGGVAVGTQSFPESRPDERIRVVFRSDRVLSVDEGPKR